MDVIDFLQEEGARLCRIIEHLIAEYKTSPRDEVFGRVREISDGTVAHLEKQQQMLLDPLKGNPNLESQFHSISAARSALADEVGRLVIVHVDEPEYEECLASLLAAVQKHSSASDQFYRAVRTHISSRDMQPINEAFQGLIFQTPSNMESNTTTHGIQDVSVHDR